MQCRITPNSSDSQKTGDSPSGSASFGLRQGLPPLSPMSGDVSGRMLRASDLVHPPIPAALLLSLHSHNATPKERLGPSQLTFQTLLRQQDGMQVRANSSASSEEVGNMLGQGQSSGITPSQLPSSLLRGLEPSQSPSPEMSHEEALSKPRGFHISLPGAPCARYTSKSC